MLTVKDLNVYYGGIHVLKRTSLGVKQGQIVTLIGASGGGKSTTLNTICLLVPVHSRVAEFMGVDLVHGRKSWLTRKRRPAECDVHIHLSSNYAKLKHPRA